MNLRLCFYCTITLLFYSCRHVNKQVIVVQPLGNFSKEKALFICNALQQVDSNTVLRLSITMPTVAFYPPRNRYRADTIINYLGRHIGKDTVVIGITDYDISTAKNNITDWGVIGLGYCPGNACVVSTFRLSKQNTYEQLYKVALHELGHTQGLPHCKNKTCYMRDAEGENHLDEETDFCRSCKAYLRDKGWILTDK